MSIPNTSPQRLTALFPTLVSGVAWLYNTEQPRAALLRPDGVALPPLAGRRLIFVPDVAGHGAAVVVQLIDAGSDAPGQREILDEDELAGLADTVVRAGGVGAHVDSPAGTRTARIQLTQRAHPSLLAAVARYRAGCPMHRRPACGHNRGAQAPCQWFARGFRALVPPSVPVPIPVEVTWPQASPASKAAAPLGLSNANAVRRDRGAMRTVASAREVIEVLSRRPHRGPATEEVLHVLKLRVTHPGLSLRELAALHEPPLSKDSYASRLRRALLVVDGSRVPVRAVRRKSFNTPDRVYC